MAVEPRPGVLRARRGDRRAPAPAAAAAEPAAAAAREAAAGRPVGRARDLSLGTKLVLTEVTVAVGKAGKGEMAPPVGAVRTAASAQPAEPLRKPPPRPGAPWWRGGQGGAGGPGAGGRGGHAVGIAYAAAHGGAVEVDFMAGAGTGGSTAPGGNEVRPGPAEHAGTY